MPAEPLAAKAFDAPAILERIPIPHAVLGTRALPGDPWLRGSMRRALHPQWLISTLDPYGRPVEAILDHDVVVGVGGLSLEDPLLAEDALTRRLVALAVANHTTARSFESRGLVTLLYNLDWVTRWRLNLRIRCNADLKRSHFNRFLRASRKAAGVAFLVPILKRIAAFAATEADAARIGRREDGSNWLRLDGPQLAARLGVTSDALLSDQRLRREIADRLGSLVNVDPGGGRARTGDKPSVRRMQHMLLPWDVLADMSARGLLPHDPLAFSPFVEDGDGVAEIAKRNGAFGWRPAISPPYFLALLDAASRWVLDYAPHLLDALAIMRDDPILRSTGGNDARGRAVHKNALSQAFNERLPMGMPCVALGWRADTAVVLGGGQPIISMMRAITHLLTACLVLLAGLGARSICGVLALRVGCVTEIKPGIYELAQRLEDGLRELDAIPVPRICAHVVGVLEKLTADTRALTGDDRLFRVFRQPWAIDAAKAGIRPEISFPKQGYLVDFAAANGLPAVDPETHAALTGDQLSLGFAVSYHHIVPGLPTEALTRIYGQFDVDDTIDYVERRLPGAAARVAELVSARQSIYFDAAGTAATDELRRILSDLKSRSEGLETVRCDVVVKMLMGIVDGSDLPGGPGGERLVLDVQGLVDEARRSVWIRGQNHPEAEHDVLLEKLSEYARRRPEVDLLGHAHCLRPRTAAELSKACCRAHAGEILPWREAARGEAPPDRPDHARAGVVPCCGCEQVAAFASDRAEISAECERVAQAGGYAETATAKESRLVLLDELRASLKRVAPSGRRVT